MDLYMDATDGSMDAMDTCNVYIYICSCFGWTDVL